jgi:hypothetical protein
MFMNKKHTNKPTKKINNPTVRFPNHHIPFNLNIQAYSKHLTTLIDNSKQDQIKKKNILCINQNQI